MPQTSLGTVLLVAFLLEAAGYLAFPFLGLQLRSQFGLSESKIGLIFMLGMWIRPIAAMVGVTITNRKSPLFSFVVACLLEAVGFAVLGFAHIPAMAIAGVLMGNIGLSLWSPNLFTLVQSIPLNRTKVSATSLLVAAMNLGGIFGTAVSGILAQHLVRLIFIIASVSFLVCIPVSWKTVALCPKERPMGGLRVSLKMFLTPAHLLLILTTLAFWASYNQFNAFYSLFVTDTLHDKKWIGISFVLLSVVTAATSFAISKYKYFSEKINTQSVIVAFLLATGWIFLASMPRPSTILVFVTFLGIAEAVWLTMLSTAWSNSNPDHNQLMQSSNFAFRNVGMGIGAWVGGYIYHECSRTSAGFSQWGIQNALWILGALAALVILSCLKSYKSPRSIT
jgi:DHA1 family multidrug resistance protein-like MFS transporter